MRDLRCPSRLHGRAVRTNLIEIKCDSRNCGAGRGVVVMHYFDESSHELVETKQFQSPEALFHKKEK